MSHCIILEWEIETKSSLKLQICYSMKITFFEVSSSKEYFDIVFNYKCLLFGYWTIFKLKKKMKIIRDVFFRISSCITVI